MEPCRRLVAGAVVVLSCILAANAAVLKDPAIVEAATLDAKFPGAAYGVPVVTGGGDPPPGGALKSNFKRFVVSRGTPNVASTGNFQPVVGNPRTIDGSSATSDSAQSVTNVAKTVTLEDQSDKLSNATEASPALLSSSLETSSPDGKSGVIRPMHVGEIVSVGTKFLSERIEPPAGQEVSIVAVVQSSNSQVPDSVKGGTVSSEDARELETAAVDKQSTVLAAVTPMVENGGAMNWTYYETVVSDKDSSDVPQASDETASVEMVTDPPAHFAAAEGPVKDESDEYFPVTEGVDGAAEAAASAEMAENFDGVTANDGAGTTVQPAEFEPVEHDDVTTEPEGFAEETTLASEEWEVHSGEKEVSGRQLGDKYYHRDAETLSEEDNEIGGSHLDDGDEDVDAGGGDCSRPCEPGAAPRVCKFTFHVEWYHTMSKACFDCPNNASDCERPHCVPADGIERPIIVVNRQMPGPTINVCQHDVVQVDVVNAMTEETTSVHWHGQHQRGSPHMDGVPFVTQCPIGPASAFRYRFVAETPGTHFWHSHTGCQRADGLYGALVVRRPRSRDSHSRLYDEEGPVVQLADWGRPLGADKFASHHHAAGDNKPTAVLVNGRAGLRWARGLRGPPPATFTVQQGKRYRFRVINNGFLNCPIQMSVDGHSLLVISSDGADIDPVRVESLVTYAGERWDVVVEASAAVSSYWVRFQGLMDCGADFTKAHQVAVLRYQGSPLDRPPGNLSWEDAYRPGLSLNTLNVGPDTPDSLVVSELRAASSIPDDASLSPQAAHTFYLAYDFYAIDNPHFHHPKYYGMSHVRRTEHRLFTPQFNHLSLKLPAFPLLSQFGDLDESTTCNATSAAGRGCEAGYCECLHVLRVPLGAVVEIVLVDEGNMYNANHPFHLHGHAFRVVAMGKLGANTSAEEVRALDEAGGIRRSLHRAPVKDTVTVPDGGFTVLRVHADNPGYWLFHCHIEFHVEVGMAVVFKVGEHSDFPPPPPGFPRCNNWLPPYPSKGHTHSRLTAGPLQQERSSAPATGPRTITVLLLLVGLVAAAATTS